MKYKRFLFYIVKIAIVSIAFYFIYKELTTNKLLSVSQLKAQLTTLFSNNIWALLGVLLLTDANWLTEILKWRTLVSIEKKVTFLEAYEQCFASLTASIITPNRIGEYGAKAMYFEAKKRKKIMALNLIGNLMQLATTILFGLYGIYFFIKKFSVKIPEINSSKFLLVCIVFTLIYLFRKQLKLKSLHTYLKNISLQVYFKIGVFSILRYLFFSHQFYFLLKMFGVETDYFILISLIFSMYFIASIIPGLAIFDWVIKGSVAIWLFHFIGLNELTVVTVTTLMWILNFAIPSIIGSIFVLNFKTNKNE